MTPENETELERLRRVVGDYQRETDALALQVEAQNNRLRDLVTFLQAMISSGEKIAQRLRVLGRDPDDPIPGGVGNLEPRGLAPLPRPPV